MTISFKGRHFFKDIILMSVRWYVAYSLSYRDIEELMAERGINVDRATINRWVVKYSPELLDAFKSKKKPVNKSWRMDETYVKIKGKWYYLYRAVDKFGDTIDFLLSKNRTKKAARKFFNKAIKSSGIPEKITIDKSGANKAGIDSINKKLKKDQRIKIRQIKYLNNIIEQDHRFIKKIIKPAYSDQNSHQIQSKRSTKSDQNGHSRFNQSCLLNFFKLIFDPPLNYMSFDVMSHHLIRSCMSYLIRDLV